jgi:LysR family transcriptional regulator, carnitine catabolism transcriptional activator
VDDSIRRHLTRIYDRSRINRCSELINPPGVVTVLDLDVHHLRALVAVADTGGFTAAAAQLGTTQSAVSRVVAEAERRLRTPVFVRTTRRVAPSEQGRALLPLVRRLVEDLDAGLHHLEGYLAGTRGTVTVAALPSVAAILLPPVIAAHRRRHPDVDVRVTDGLADTVAQLLTRGEVDLAVTVGPVDGRTVDGRTGDGTPLARDTFVLAAHPDHPLATRSAVAWSELDGESLVVFGPRSSIASPVERALQDAGAVPGVLHVAQNVAAVAGMVGAGLGVTAVPGLVLPLIAFAGLRAVPLTPTVRRSVRLHRDPARPMAAAVTAFAEALMTSSDALVGDLPAVSWGGQ